MKKRLLALALCLVLMTSLLPITAAAATVNEVYITGTGFETGVGSAYVLKDKQFKVTVDGSDGTTMFDGRSFELFQDASCTTPVQNAPVDGETYYLMCKLAVGDPLMSFTLQTKYVLKIEGYTTEFLQSKSNYDPLKKFCIFPFW